ncbi:hypothetical protein OBBRIDRAFT_795780 [Obba rivulosa]|uniref:Zn(2)-C6 fungal-type domain-containing protein n=1 Tax=Obba rivulosa TaxID=1052685 RepID=A0A8E2ATT5_9APHY|nr:hypothetical protein OBBRIDRAFT_795780 [Obba rivulosa]
MNSTTQCTYTTTWEELYTRDLGRGGVARSSPPLPPEETPQVILDDAFFQYLVGTEQITRANVPVNGPVTTNQLPPNQTNPGYHEAYPPQLHQHISRGIWAHDGRRPVPLSQALSAGSTSSRPAPPPDAQTMQGYSAATAPAVHMSSYDVLYAAPHHTAAPTSNAPVPPSFEQIGHPRELSRDEMTHPPSAVVLQVPAYDADVDPPLLRSQAKGKKRDTTDAPADGPLPEQPAKKRRVTSAVSAGPSNTPQDMGHAGTEGALQQQELLKPGTDVARDETDRKHEPAIGACDPCRTGKRRCERIGDVCKYCVHMRRKAACTFREISKGGRPPKKAKEEAERRRQGEMAMNRMLFSAQNPEASIDQTDPRLFLFT